MLSFMKKMANACLRPAQRFEHSNRDDRVYDPLLWSKDLGRHSAGEYSFAVIQANEPLEDHSQVETGRAATFVGVYDGHRGPEAAKFVSDHLFLHLIKFAQETGTISEDVIRNAFSATEDGFLAHIRRMRPVEPKIAASGSCCLVAIIWRETLYVANLGDSRAVMGCLGRSNHVAAEQITLDHNASVEEVRQELRSLHPDDSHIVVLKNGVWRVKGIIQVSRSIGDAYLKWPEYAIDPSLDPRLALPEPLTRSVLSAEPSITRRVLRPYDKFLILASDGLWDHLSNQKAVEIVHSHPRKGIARRLARMALEEAIKMKDSSLWRMPGGCRMLHDDITVIVIFIDHDHLIQPDPCGGVPELSLRGFVDAVGPCEFSVLDGI
ncbi:putative protein phosphatase 2C 43 [Wolffia australiana]